MSERTIWMGIKAEAKLRMGDYDLRISGIRQQMRSLLIPTNPVEINDALIHSLAVDLRAAKVEYLDAAAKVSRACEELGEIS